MEEPRTFVGESQYSMEQAIHAAGEQAADAEDFDGKLLRVISQEVVISNPHINEFRVVLGPGD